MDDHTNPATWAAMRIKAIEGVKVRNLEPAKEYLRFVEQHRGREVAEAARRSILAAAKGS